MFKVLIFAGRLPYPARLGPRCMAVAVLVRSVTGAVKDRSREIIL